MRRILTWAAFFCALGPLLAVAVPHVVLAQQAQAPAEAAAKFEPGRLGAELRGLSEQSVKALGLTQAHAILVVLPLPDGPAERAGLRPGDVILELDGAPVGALQDLITAIQRLGAGRVITLGIRRGNERVALPATLGRLADGQNVAGPADLEERRLAAYESIVGLFDPKIFPLDWAAVQVDLGLTHQNRVGGKRVDNLEKAIAAFEAALTVRTREALPREWAITQAVLGAAYQNRIGGKRADNLEKAIAAYEAALTVTTREALPRNWANTQYSLGVTYSYRIRGERADNLEKAIAAFEQALTVFTREALPRDWAHTQIGLGNIYQARIRGEPADNLEKAIAAYEAALTVTTREALPRDWALTHNNLGNAYSERIRGDRADNLEKAIAAFGQALTVFTREALPHQWADTQTNLGLTYADRVRGDRAENLEKAIAAFEAALTVRTREALPRDWALTQNNLGNAYSYRIRGDRADNLEKAIAAFEAALTVRTREALPRDWALTQNNLGNAYSERIRGDRADNLEKAIAAFEAALTVRTREALPRDWASTQALLGGAYWARIRGDRVDNQEKAITAYETALTVFTREVLPRDWAHAQNNLGNAFWIRIRGDRADNLEKAIAAFEQALTVFTREALPRDWAHTRYNLGNAYSYRIRGDRADNLEKAIAAYEAALTVLTRETLPYEWATTQLGLGHAYGACSRGDWADNSEKAIAAFEQALTVFTREALPHQWAHTRYNLGNAYSYRIRGDRADNLEKAIAAYEAAHTVMTRETLPHQWATTQIGLGHAYWARVHGNKADNLEKAITAYEAALAVFTREALPHEHLRAGQRLGSVLAEARAWRKAELAYASARDAFLLLFGQGLNEAEGRYLIAETGPMFAEAAFAAAQLGDSEKALALASEGRARLMAVALKLQTLDLPADKRQRLDALRADIRLQERAAEAAQGAARAAAVEQLVGLRHELLGLLKEADTAEAKVRGSALAQARIIAGKDGAVVVPIVSRFGGKILIIANRARLSEVGAKSAAEGPTPSIAVIDLPALTADALERLLRGKREDGTPGGWLGSYPASSLSLLELRRREREWPAALDRLLPELWPLFAEELDAALKVRGLPSGARIVWLPTGALGILPLGAAQNPTTERRLSDDYEIVYAPSLEALAAAQARIAKAAPASLAAVINPTGDLTSAELEGFAVASHFSRKASIVLKRAAATPDAVLAALRRKTYWHFATHGTFSWSDVRQSALALHGDARLSVGHLIEASGAGGPRLVVLSACETGLHDIGQNPDEFIGLPSTFAALGAAGVISTLWPVDDHASSLLIAKFYELHMGSARLPPPTALNRAQAWLRAATQADIRAYSRAAAAQGSLTRQQLVEIEHFSIEEGISHRRLRIGTTSEATPPTTKTEATSASRPYAHPDFWAAFIYTGL